MSTPSSPPFQVMEDMADIFSKVDKGGEGVCVQVRGERGRRWEKARRICAYILHLHTRLSSHLSTPQALILRAPEALLLFLPERTYPLASYPYPSTPVHTAGLDPGCSGGPARVPEH